MEEGGSVMLAKPMLCRPKLVVAPRDPHEGFMQGGLNSGTPTPMIFGSSLYADRDLYTDCKSFLSLLAETPGSPNFAPAALVDGFASNRSATDIPSYSRAEEQAQIKLEEDHGDSQCISSARYKAMVPSRLPITSSSPHLTISPGISPASLLESPILFSTRQMDASPTTGSFSIPLDTWGEGLPRNANMSENGARSPERNDSFAFKPLPLVEGYGSPSNISMGTFEMHGQGNSLYSDGIHMQSEEFVYDPLQASDRQGSSISSSGVEAQDHLKASAAIQPADVCPPMSFQPADVGMASFVSGVTSNGRVSFDGFNWKKYGQKTLKNSENPRNYYKCTHPNCPAKRLVECSNEGDVIIYKGTHNHAKPEGNRRRAKTVGHSSGAAHPEYVRDSRAGSKVIHANNLDDMPPVSYAASHGGFPGTSELSFTSPSNEDEENGDRYDSEDESHPKRRRLDSEEKNRHQRESLRTAREPRVIVKTESEKDIIDDGYRWRKYGQKVVKGNHYPRNYYKCTNIGCRVKKLVERSSSDVKSVMTTYEGKHNHGVPPPRGNMQENEDTDIFCEDDSHLELQDHAGGSESNSYIF